MGGHIEHGETPEEALAKEVREEIGWNIADLDIETIGKMGPRDGLNTISFVYVIHTDNTPDLSPEDFKSAEWLSPEIILENIKNGHPAKTNLPYLLERVSKN